MAERELEEVHEADLYFETEIKTGTDYSKCIICQVGATKALHKVQPSTQRKLQEATEARLDGVAMRLKDEITNKNWLDNQPKWHDKCRNSYINEKNYLMAKKKRSQKSEHQQTEKEETASIATRSKVPTFDAKNTCIICNRHWSKGKAPTSKISTIQAQKTLTTQAQKLNRQDILHRLVGEGCDMVANDICYHTPCMNKFKATRVPSGTGMSIDKQMHEAAFTALVDELEIPLFQNSQGFLIKSLRDKYRENLKKLGVANAESYRSHALREKISQYYGSRVSILDQSYEAGFLCASDIPLGDAFKKLSQIQKSHNMDKKDTVLHKAAKILRDDAKLCKKEHKNDLTIDVSFTAASELVPESMFNFAASLLCDKVWKYYIPLSES